MQVVTGHPALPCVLWNDPELLGLMNCEGIHLWVPSPNICSGFVLQAERHRLQTTDTVLSSEDRQAPVKEANRQVIKPSVVGQMAKEDVLLYIYTMEYYSAIKKEQNW